MKNLIKVLGVFFVLASCTHEKQTQVERIISEFNNPTSSNVLVVAHRGDWRHAPENSIKGIKLCIDKGIDVAEVDVSLTKDKQLVLMHDETIDRTTNGKGKVSDYTLAELKQFYLKANQGGENATLTKERIPTLEDILLTAKGKIMLNLDKSFDKLSEINPVLIKTKTLGLAILKGSFDANEALENLSKLDKKILYISIVEDENRTKEEEIKEIRKQLELVHPVAFELILSKNDDILSETEYIKSNGSRVWVNTLWGSISAGYTDEKALKDPDGNWGHLIDKGVNIIQSDNPVELIQYLKGRGLRNF